MHLRFPVTVFYRKVGNMSGHSHGEPIKIVWKDDGIEPVTLEKGKNYTLIIPPKASTDELEVDFVEVPDVLFHLNSAVPCLDPNNWLIEASMTTFVMAEKNKDKHVVIFGHTDRSADNEYNLELSELRSKAFKALLEKDSGTWEEIRTAKSKVEDRQRILKTLADVHGWSCDPGHVDNQDGPMTQKAVENYQHEYNGRFNSSLKIDGIFGPKTWESMLFVCHSLIRNAFKAKTGSQTLPSCAWGYKGRGVYPCGECLPKTPETQYRSSLDRRIEVVFYDKGELAGELIEPSATRTCSHSHCPITGKAWKKKPVEVDAVLIENIKMEITDIPGTCAPSAEGCTIKYKAVNGDPPSGSKSTVVIKDTSGAVIFEKKDLALKKNKVHEFKWDGKGSDGKYPDLVKGPFTVTVSKTGDPASQSKKKSVKVEVGEIDLEIKDVNSHNRLIENTPGKDFEVVATVYVKKSDGTKVVSEVPVTVDFTYIDPAPANTKKVDSFQYSTGNFLGKADDTAAVFWKAHADCSSSSGDGYKNGCKVKTVTTSGSSELGKAKIYFKPSNVGGDKFKIKATVYAADGTTVLKSKESNAFSIWRKVELTAYEMAGFSHVSTHGTESKMNKYYTNDMYVRYIRGTMNAVGATYKVKYVGLWDHSTSAQRSWATEQQKTPAETPTADETSKANGSAGADRTAARAAIQAKATAWKDRIYGNMIGALIHWPTDAGIPPNSIMALEYCHPKYDSQSPSSDAQTSQWAAYPWLRINYRGHNVHPDARWGRAQSFAFQTRVFILAGMTAARYEVVIAHEIGHVTKDQFKRDVFGGGDHSASAGLMDTTGSVASFNPREKKILRGIKP